jgi:hypothetical protein
MTLQPESGLIFKVKTADVTGLLADMKNQWDAYHTEEPFTYAFMDDLLIERMQPNRKQVRSSTFFLY